LRLFRAVPQVLEARNRLVCHLLAAVGRNNLPLTLHNGRFEGDVVFCFVELDGGLGQVRACRCCLEASAYMSIVIAGPDPGCLGKSGR